jgi:colanic acid/amylovoran biosynthesis protein
MDLNYLEYSNRCEYASVYKNVLTDTIKELLLKGYNITILGMCERENDLVIAQEIVNELYDARIKVLSYPSDCINTIVSEIARSEYLISTRFHSFVLGVIFGCKVLPISYNYKIANTIKDIGFTGEYIELSDLESLSGKDMLSKLLNVKEFILDEEIYERASKHFTFLDDILI